MSKRHVKQLKKLTLVILEARKTDDSHKPAVHGVNALVTI